MIIAALMFDATMIDADQNRWNDATKQLDRQNIRRLPYTGSSDWKTWLYEQYLNQMGRSESGWRIRYICVDLFPHDQRGQNSTQEAVDSNKSNNLR